MLESAVLVRPLAGRQWLWPVSVFAAALALWTAAYWPAIAAAVQAWWVSPSYSHCFLIIPICAFLVWQRRRQLASLTPHPFLPALLLALPAGLLWLAGNAAMVNEAQQFAAIAMLQMLVLGIFGPRVYRALLFPCLFLFFLVPTGEYLIGPLQRFTTWFVSAGLSLLGILHFTEGNVIRLVNGNFEVAEACAGLRFLTANMVLSILFAHFAFRRPFKIALFMAAAVIVPIIGNGLRALGIVLIAHWTDNRLAVGADHLIYGWGFSALLLFLLFAIGACFRDPIEPDRPLPYFADLRPPPGHRLLSLVAVAGLLIVAPPAIASTRDIWAGSAAIAPAVKLPPGWSMKRVEGAWSPDLPRGNPQLQLDVRQGQRNPVSLFLSYYPTATKDHSLVLGLQRLWVEGKFNLVSVSDIPGSRHVPKLSELILDSGSEQRMVWWSYWNAGHFTTSGTEVRLISLMHVFQQRSGSAFIAISVPITGTPEEARSRLRTALWAFEALPADSTEQN